MNRHTPFLELAATAIDYPLDASERRHLDEHLAGCRDCVRASAAIGADAAAIGSLPPAKLSERRGDQILAAALRPAAQGHALRLVAIAALLALLITGSIAVGAVLLHRMDEELSIVLPVPSATASPDPKPRPTPSASSRLIAVTPWERFVVTSEDQLRSWVEVVMPDGSRTRLAEGASAAWLDSDRIVYECSQPSPDFLGICSMDAAASGSVQAIMADANHPAPAPDGRSIAFHRAGIDVGETWIVNADGSDERRLAPGWLLEWSPDGAWLAGQSDGAAVEVAIIGADGTGLRPLAPGHDPAWSPAGDRLVYVFNDDQGAASLRTVDVATGDVTVEYAAGRKELSEPAWLGDRGWVFVQDGDVWRLDVGASDPVRLTTDLAIGPGTLSGDPLSVSGDNQWVAFTTGIDTDSNVGIVSAYGDLDVMYPGKAGMSDPDWAPEPGADAAASAPPTPPASVPPASSAPTASAKSPGGDRPVGWVWTAATVQAVTGRPVGLVEAVTAGGPGFVAVGRGCIPAGENPTCEGVVWTSTDGQAWARVAASDALDTGASFPTSGPELGMYDVAAGGPGIVAIGYAARPDMQATIWYSPDAASWERIPLGPAGRGTAPGNSMDIRIEAVTWDGQRFVAVGTDRSDLNGRNLGEAKARAAVWTSTDGRSWDRVPHTADLDVGGFVDTLEDPATGGMFDVVAGPAGLVAVGSVCDPSPAGCQPAAWTSADGATWQRVSEVPDAAGVLGSVAASSAAYLAVGMAACDGCQALAFTSFDGRSWAPQTFDGRHDFTTVAAIDDMLLAIAADEPTTVWTSDDGVVWLQSAVAGGPTTGGVSDWHLAATPDTAVWLGSTAASDVPEAWVSEGPTSP